MEMTETEHVELENLGTAMDLTDIYDWRDLAATVEQDITAGVYSPEFVAAYRQMLGVRQYRDGVSSKTQKQGKQCT